MHPDQAIATVSHGDPIAPVIFGVTLILIAALVGRIIARRFRQPSVLGELIMGVLLRGTVQDVHVRCIGRYFTG